MFCNWELLQQVSSFLRKIKKTPPLLLIQRCRFVLQTTWVLTLSEITQTSAICAVRSLINSAVTPRCRVLLEQLTGLQLVKKFPAFHGTRRFITALTSVRHLSLSWANPIQSIFPHPTSWRSILILPTHLRLGLPSCLFPSGFPTKTLYSPLSSSIRGTILGEEYKSFSSSLCNLLINLAVRSTN